MLTRSDGAPDIAPGELEFDPATDFVGSGVFGKVYKGRCAVQAVVRVARRWLATQRAVTAQLSRPGRRHQGAAQRRGARAAQRVCAEH